MLSEQVFVEKISQGLIGESSVGNLWFLVGYHSMIDENKKVEELLQEIISINPFDACAYMNLGVCMRRNDDIQSSLAFLGCAAELEEDNAEIAFNYGATLLLSEQYKKAHVLLERAVELSPNNLKYRKFLGHSYVIQLQFQEAIECFEFIIEQRPNNANSHENLGMIYKEYGELDKALFHLKKAIESDHKSVEAYRDLIQITLWNDDLDGAIEIVNEAIRFNPFDYWLKIDRLAITVIVSNSKTIQPELDELKKLMPDCETDVKTRTVEFVNPEVIEKILKELESLVC